MSTHADPAGAARGATDLDDETDATADDYVSKGSRGLYMIAKSVGAPLARLIYRPHVIGRKNVPKTGPVIFASNHLSFVDSVAIPLCAPRRVRFLAKSSYFDGTGFRG